MVIVDIKVPKRRVLLETKEVERGSEFETKKNAVRQDKCLPPIYRYRTWLI